MALKSIIVVTTYLLKREMFLPGPESGTCLPFEKTGLSPPVDVATKPSAAIYGMSTIPEEWSGYNILEDRDM